MNTSQTIAQACQILQEVASGQGDPSEILVMAGALAESSPEASELLRQGFRAITAKDQPEG